MKKILVFALAAVLSLGILAGCGGGGKTVPLTVNMGENGAMTYSPATLSVAKGDAVEVTLVNKDSAQAHSFIINELNVKTEQVPAGTTKKTTFKADKAGTFEYYCDVPGHKDGGMHGTLTVKG
ncbi:MAG TPA: cupredoxin domain-containing protein [Symbiobacteriaceae bacterium]|jgi:nitrosocyanin